MLLTIASGFWVACRIGILVAAIASLGTVLVRIAVDVGLRVGAIFSRSLFDDGSFHLVFPFGVGETIQIKWEDVNDSFIKHLLSCVADAAGANAACLWDKEFALYGRMGVPAGDHGYVTDTYGRGRPILPRP